MSDLQIKLGDRNGDGRNELAYLDCIDGEPFRDKVDMASGREREESIKRAVRHFGIGGNDIPELSRQLAKLAADVPTQARLLPPIRDAYDRRGTELVLPQELIQGMLHQGSKLQLGGASKGFTTWTLEYLALAIAYGLPWLGCQTRRSKVLLLDMELQEPFLDRRLNTLTEALKISEEPDWLDKWPLRGFTCGHREIFPRIIERISGKEYGLVVLDPIYKLYGGHTDENSARDVGDLLNSIEALSTQTGAAVVYRGHFSKGNQSGKSAIDRVSGSGVWSRDADSLLNLTAHAENECCYTLDATLRNFPPMEPFVVEWRFPLFDRRNDLDPTALKKPMGRPSKYSPDDLFGTLVDGMTAGEWRTASGMSNDVYLRLRCELESTGRVKQDNHGWQKFQ